MLTDQGEFEVDERVLFVDHARYLAVSAFCVKGAGSGCFVECIEAYGIGGPRASDCLCLFQQETADSFALKIGMDGHLLARKIEAVVSGSVVVWTFYAKVPPRIRCVGISVYDTQKVGLKRNGRPAA